MGGILSRPKIPQTTPIAPKPLPKPPVPLSEGARTSIQQQQAKKRGGHIDNLYNKQQQNGQNNKLGTTE